MTGNAQIAIFRAPLVMGWSGIGVDCKMTREYNKIVNDKEKMSCNHDIIAVSTHTTLLTRMRGRNQ